MSEKTQPHEPEVVQPLLAPIKRRSFFMYAGATAGATALLLSGCDDDDETDVNANLLDVGSGDGGILNYAYALEQLEAAFYARIKDGTYYKNLSPSGGERQILDDLAGHEAIHRDALKAVLMANGITPLKDLEPNFDAIRFDNRASVLEAAQTFEDTGVAAYNGAGRFISNNLYLGLAGKIVSVEARHAALIRDLRSFNSFVGEDVVNLFTQTSGAAPGTGTARLSTGNGNPGPGQERSKRPPTVLAAVNAYLKEGSKLSARSFA